MTKRFIQLKNKYQHGVMLVALIGGFVLDMFTLTRIDQVFDNGLLIAHLVVVAGSIALLFSRDTRFGRRFLTETRGSWLQTAMVFSFGALFSGFIIFYTRSGSLLTSWPFILSMLVLMLSTEFRKRYFNKLTLQIIIFYFAILSWMIFFIPVITKHMGPWIFVASTLMSLVLIWFYLILLGAINPARLRINRTRLIRGIVLMAIVFNGLYFLNIIPPIPLSMKYQGVYYNIERTEDGYSGEYEKASPFRFWQEHNRSLLWSPGEDLFAFTQIFAPTNLKTDINHVWEFYDKGNRRWISKDSIALSITGGSAEGYRGFSAKTNLEYGAWRVRTTTPHGQTVGILRFKIVSPSSTMREIVTEAL